MCPVGFSITQSARWHLVPQSKQPSKAERRTGGLPLCKLLLVIVSLIGRGLHEITEGCLFDRLPGSGRRPHSEHVLAAEPGSCSV